HVRQGAPDPPERGLRRGDGRDRQGEESPGHRPGPVRPRARRDRGPYRALPRGRKILSGSAEDFAIVVVVVVNVIVNVNVVADADENRFTSASASAFTTTTTFT